MENITGHEYTRRWEKLIALFKSTPELEERIEQLRIERTDPAKQRFDSEDFRQFIYERMKKLGRKLTAEEEKKYLGRLLQIQSGKGKAERRTTQTKV